MANETQILTTIIDKNITNPVILDRDLFEWLVDYTLELRGEWQWKRNSTKRNNEDMARLDEHIFQALKIREQSVEK